MPQKAPNDRINQFNSTADTTLNKKIKRGPRVYIVADGSQFEKPSLETYFAEYEDFSQANVLKGCSCDAVSVICTCNKVCTCNPQCSCIGDTCSCVGYSSGGGGSWCSCNKVCSCVPVH